ncbi:MAG: hypothetical protein N3F64_00970 [Nitrososphaeria archaeon]|nr:hypothetical protein [Nitrososphaeria archaeon]
MTNDMISWSKAFYKGFIILLWSILWAIVGFLLFSFAISSILASFITVVEDPTQIINNPQILQEIVTNYMWPIMLSFIVISIFVGVAVYATMIKVIGNTILEEIKKMPSAQTLPVPPPPPPPTEPEKY